MLRSYLITLLLTLLVITSSTAVMGEPNSITHGPMLGRPTPNSIRVWGRTAQPGQFEVHYGTAENALQHSSVATTNRDDDNSGWVELKELAPATKYYYELYMNKKGSGLRGTFKTLPSKETYYNEEFNPRGLHNFRFEFACGNNQSATHGIGPSLPTYTTMNREIRDKIDFAILNGDWLYEDSRDHPPKSWLADQGIQLKDAPHSVRTAPTTVGVWENYKVYMSRAKNLAEWHRHVPTYYTFDDHELVNDIFASGETGYRHRRAVFRDIAVNAWFDYLGWSNPTETTQGVHFGMTRFKKGSDILVDPLPTTNFKKIDWKQAANLHVHWGGPNAGMMETEYDEEPGNPNSGVYEVVEVLDEHRLRIKPAARADGSAAYSIGRRSYGNFRVANCEFFLLDTRTHRELHDVRNPAKPGLSMLGMQQRKWLMEEMENSDADFFFMVSSVNFMIPHVGGGGVQFDVSNKDDAWTVFLDERETLIDFWDKLNKPVFVLTGDLHNSFAIKVTDRVWEFASGPHNSVNHRPQDEGDRPVTGRYQYGPRPCEIRWSSYCLPDIPRPARLFPHYCVVQVNNVFNNPIERDGDRWIAFPQPQVIFQYFDGFTGDLRYSETISMTSASELVKKKWQKRQQEFAK